MLIFLFSLGAGHDGGSDDMYKSCPTTQNYVMTPVAGASSDNLLNALKFSSCSVNAFKSVLLANSNRFIFYLFLIYLATLWI